METTDAITAATTASNDYFSNPGMRKEERVNRPQKEGDKTTMKIYKYESLAEFDFWSGAKDTVKYLTDEDLDIIEEILGDLEPDGLSETEVNDIFWHEDDLIAEWLGYNNFEEIMEREEV